MDNVKENTADLAGNPPAAQPPTRFFKLPDFWTASPAAWFAVAEAQFLLRSTTQERERFALIATVLPEASACRVAHIPARGPHSPKELQEVPLQLRGASFVYVHRGSAKPPLAPA